MNIFLHELKIHRKSLFFWCLGMFLLVWSGMEKYSGLQLSGDAANQMLAQIPSSVRKVIGVDSLDINTAVGFYGVLFIYILVMVAIQAVLLGTSLITKEERDKTAEFLLTKPISRKNVILEKLMSGIVIITILNFFTLCVSIYMVASHNNGNPDIKIAILLMFAMYLVQLIFFSLGALVGSESKNPKKASVLSTSMMMLAFVIYVFTGITNKLGFLTAFSPFKYFEASKIIETGSLNIYFVLLSVFLVTIFTVATLKSYDNKDLNL